MLIGTPYLLPRGMHNLVVCPTKYGPEPSLCWVRCQKIARCENRFSIYLGVQDTRENMRVRLKEMK